MNNRELFSFATDDALAGAVANFWLDELAARADDPAPYCVALSGGRIAKKFFAAVAERAPTRPVSFGHVHFFWADERCVPPTDAERSEEHTSELQSRSDLVCRLLLEKKK